MKRSFILYLDDISGALEELTDAEAGKLFRAIIAHELKRENANIIEPIFDDRALRLALSHITRTLDRDAEKWENTRQKRVIAGAKGGKASGEKRSKSKQNKQVLNLPSKRSKSKQNEANEAVNVNVNDNVNVNVNDNVICQSILERLSEDEQRTLEQNIFPGCFMQVINKVDEQYQGRFSEVVNPFKYCKTVAENIGAWKK